MSAHDAYSVVDIDRDESRSAMLDADRYNEPHPEDCRCRPCISDRYDDADEWRHRGGRT